MCIHMCIHIYICVYICVCIKGYIHMCIHMWVDQSTTHVSVRRSLPRYDAATQSCSSCALIHTLSPSSHPLCRAHNEEKQRNLRKRSPCLQHKP